MSLDCTYPIGVSYTPQLERDIGWQKFSVENVVQIRHKGSFAKAKITRYHKVIAGDQNEKPAIHEGLTGAGIESFYIYVRLVKEI